MIVSDTSPAYLPESVTAADVEARPGPLVLDFGTYECGYCRRAAPLLAEVQARHPDVSYIKVEDGWGRPLGRAFGVKLWPTLVLLQDGVERARVVRPTDPGTVEEAFAKLTV
jgi:thioredoxin 1